MSATTAPAETAAETAAAGTAPTRRGPWSRVGAVLSTTALAVVVLVALVMIVVPILLRATPYTVLTGSMAPTIPPGSLVVVRPVPFEDIVMGDVVTYQLRSGESTVVTHRVIGVGTRGDGKTVLTLQGDANPAPDTDPVTDVQVRGTVAYHLPYLGYVNLWVGVNRPGWLLKGAAALLIGYGLVLLAGGLRDRARRRSEPAGDGSDDDASDDDGSDDDGSDDGASDDDGSDGGASDDDGSDDGASDDDGSDDDGSDDDGSDGGAPDGEASVGDAPDDGASDGDAPDGGASDGDAARDGSQVVGGTS